MYYVIGDTELHNNVNGHCEQEISKMFSESSSFYYSVGGDLTNSVQRQRSRTTPDPSEPPWTSADDRFFWNKHMLHDLIGSRVSGAGNCRLVAVTDN